MFLSHVILYVALLFEVEFMGCLLFCDCESNISLFHMRSFDKMFDSLYPLFSAVVVVILAFGLIIDCGICKVCFV